MPATSTAVLAFIWIALSAWLVGGAILRWCGQDLGPGLRCLLALALGLPILAYAVLALGLLGRLGHTPLLCLLLIADGLGLALGWSMLKEAGTVLRRVVQALLHSRGRIAYWALTLWFLVMLPRVLAPPAFEDWDGLAEHLAMAKLWLISGSIHPLWFMHQSEFPATVQMLYLLGIAFGGPVAARLVHYLFGMLTILAVGLLARRHFGRETAPVAMVILAGTPLVAGLAPIAYVDLGATFYLILGFSFFLDWLRAAPPSCPRGGGPVLAGIFLGVAMAIKMQAILFFGVLAAGALFVSYRRRRGAHPLTAGQILAFVGLAVIVASPWYLKSWIWTGNPVYPFAYNLFDGKYWSPRQAEGYTYTQRQWGWGELPPFEEYSRLSPAQRAFLGPRRPDHLLLAPLGMTFFPWFYADLGAPRPGIVLGQAAGPLYLAFLPLLLLFRRRPWAWRVTAWAMAPIAVWFLANAQYSRYFLPALAWLAAPAAWAVCRAAQRSPLLRCTTNAALGVMLLVTAGFTAANSSVQLSLLKGEVTPKQYLLDHLRPYGGEDFLNHVMRPGDKLITYGEPRMFYLNYPYMWGDPTYHRLLNYDKMATATDLVASYRQFGITYVWITPTSFANATGESAHLVELLQAAIREGKLRAVPMLGPGPLIFRLEPG